MKFKSSSTVMNYNLYVFKFLLLIVVNFLFIFQTFFSLNFFFSSKIDEELIICFAIFFVFILVINHIVTSLQDMLQGRIDVYVNLFIMTFKLLRKALKRFKKHNERTLGARELAFTFVLAVFFRNLSSLANYETLLNNYLIQLRLKLVIDAISVDLELKSQVYRKALLMAYLLELNYLNSVRMLRNF
jgi:hypothetical protein